MSQSRLIVRALLLFY